MKRLILLFIFIIFISFGTYYVIGNEFVADSMDELISTEQTDVPKLKSKQESKDMIELLEGDLFSFIDKSSDEVEKKFGKPIRKDLTPYDYTWWVYTDQQTYQIQFGIEDGLVKTIYATGEDVSIEPFKIGASYDSIDEQFPFENKVTYQTGLAFYSFLLNETDLNTNPLIKLSDDVFVQCYFDTFTEKLSSLRIVKGDVLLKQRVYEMEYRGSLPDEKVISDEEWKEIEKGMAQQIFDLTNIYRYRFDVAPLVRDENVSEVALLHSKDMFEQNYFSHYSLDGNGLKERLEEKEIYYLSAGENIAAQHTDAPAAVEGWLNSEGHREALLQNDYTHLGIGVYRLYYTQNFLLKP